MLLILLTCFCCSKDKFVILPEIGHSRVSELTEVSAAYLFYNETLPDSIELNRKNLISTTNWLINVDKRLTLKQAMPNIKFLQEKKENSSHKKEGVKNYFTCNNTSIKNLGFIDFTNINYHFENDTVYRNPTSKYIIFNTLDNIKMESPQDSVSPINTTIANLLKDISLLTKKENKPTKIILKFSQDLSFQDYITIKSTLENLNPKNPEIVTDEFIFN